MTRSFFTTLVGSIAIVLGSAPSLAQNAYITNARDNTVSVIATATNTVVGLPIPVGDFPFGVAVSPDGSKVYVANTGYDTRNSTVSVIATATNMVIATIPVGYLANGIAVTPDGSTAYVATANSSTVSVIDTATNMVVGTIPVGSDPYGIAITPDGSKVYVTNASGNTVSVIASATNTVTATIQAGALPFGAAAAVTPDGSTIYVTNVASSTISVIDTATNTVAGTIPVGYGNYPRGIAVRPDGSEVYVAIEVAGTTGYPVPGIVSVIDTMTNTVVGSPIPVGSDPYGIAITPDGSKVYVTNEADNTVSVIDTATNMVVAVLPVGGAPIGFGVFIQPRFAGTPGNRECHHKSISALTRTFGGLNRATIALGFPTVEGLLSAVNAFCGDRACDEEDRRACMFVGENSEHRAVRRRERSSFSR